MAERSAAHGERARAALREGDLEGATALAEAAEMEAAAARAKRRDAEAMHRRAAGAITYNSTL